MDAKDPIGDEEIDDDLLEVANNHYEEALKALDRFTKDLKEGKDVKVGDLVRTASDLRKATQTLFDERKRIAERKKTETDAGDDAALDLEAARSEIGSRLDRLRRSRRTGAVS